MGRTTKRFHEQFGKLGRGENKGERDQYSKKLLLHEMTIKFHMLGSFVTHCIPSNVNGGLTIRMDWH